MYSLFRQSFQIIHFDLIGSCTRLYEEFRPEIPSGKRWWGASEKLDLDRNRKMARSKEYSQQPKEGMTVWQNIAGYRQSIGWEQKGLGGGIKMIKLQWVKMTLVDTKVEVHL